MPTSVPKSLILDGSGQWVFTYQVQLVTPVHSASDFKLMGARRLFKFMPWSSALVITSAVTAVGIHPHFPFSLFYASLLPLNYCVILSILRLWSVTTEFWLVMLVYIFSLGLPKERSSLFEPLIIDLEKNLPVQADIVSVPCSPNCWKIKVGDQGFKSSLGYMVIWSQLELLETVSQKRTRYSFKK